MKNIDLFNKYVVLILFVVFMIPTNSHSIELIKTIDSDFHSWAFSDEYLVLWDVDDSGFAIVKYTHMDNVENDEYVSVTIPNNNLTLAGLTQDNLYLICSNQDEITLKVLKLKPNQYEVIQTIQKDENLLIKTNSYIRLNKLWFYLNGTLFKRNTDGTLDIENPILMGNTGFSIMNGNTFYGLDGGIIPSFVKLEIHNNSEIVKEEYNLELYDLAACGCGQQPRFLEYSKNAVFITLDGLCVDALPVPGQMPDPRIPEDFDCTQEKFYSMILIEIDDQSELGIFKLESLTDPIEFPNANYFRALDDYVLFTSDKGIELYNYKNREFTLIDIINDVYDSITNQLQWALGNSNYLIIFAYKLIEYDGINRPVREAFLKIYDLSTLQSNVNNWKVYE